MRYGYTKADRILKRSEFQRLFLQGRKVQNRYFIAVFSPGQFQRSRLGVTVAKKVGNAATRNRIKRFSREYFRRNRHRITGYWDINIIARKEAAELSSEQAYQSLGNLLKKISGSKED